MASASPPEYESARKLYNELNTIAKIHCNELCDCLYADDLISTDVRDFVHDGSISVCDKAHKLIDTVIDVFKIDPTKFYEFLTILKHINGPLISSTVLKLEQIVSHKKKLTVKLESSSSSQDSNEEEDIEDKLTSSESSFHSALSHLSDSIKESEVQDIKEQDAQDETKDELILRSVSIASSASSGYGSIRDSTISENSTESNLCPPLNAVDPSEPLDDTISDNTPLLASDNGRTLSLSEPIKRKRSSAFNTIVKPKEIEKSRHMAKNRAHNKKPPWK